MRSFFATIGFLTIIPLPKGWYGDERDLARGTKWFAVVGLLIGLIAAGLDWCFLRLFPGTLIPSVLTVFVLVAISGGLHMDGLADTADAFLSARKRERMLEIMKDSRIGTMGVLAIVFVLIIKIAALNAIPLSYRPFVILAIPTFSRLLLPAHMFELPYAREGRGLGNLFDDSIMARIIIAPFSILFAVLQPQKLGCVVAALFASAFLLFWNWRCNRKIGGYTGDTLGALCEITECVVALSFAGWFAFGGPA